MLNKSGVGAENHGGSSKQLPEQSATFSTCVTDNFSVYQYLNSYFALLFYFCLAFIQYFYQEHTAHHTRIS